MLAALGSEITRGKWYSLIDKVYRPTTLQAAWQKVGNDLIAAGIGGQTVAAFEPYAADCLVGLEDALRKGHYQPRVVEAMDIPAVMDLIAQTALKMVVEPIFDAMFLDSSHGFRPKRGAGNAVRDADRLFREGRTHVVAVDLNGCLANLAQERISARVRERISDRHVLALMDGWLQRGIMTQLAGMTTAGELHGAVLSPLLANLVLHPLDARLVARGHRMVRYAGRMVVLCMTAEDAQAALCDVRAWSEENGLALGADNVHVRNARGRGQGFDFLGHRFEAGMAPSSMHAETVRPPPSCGRVEWQWQARAIAPRTAVLLNS